MTNRNPNIPPTSGFGAQPLGEGEFLELPPDLAELSSQLDAMAAADLAGTPTGLADRAWAMSRGNMLPDGQQVAPVNQKLERFAQHEQALAPAGLAPQAFELSREAISGGAAETVGSVRHGPSERGRAAAHSYRLTRRVLAMAASVALVGSAVYVMMNAKGGGTSGIDGTELAARLDSELSSLFEVVDNTPRDAGIAADTGSDFETSWLDDIYGKESL